jgi:hypothetical protein
MNNDHQAALKEITKKDATVHLPTSAIINGITVNDQMEILKHCSSLFFSGRPTNVSTPVFMSGTIEQVYLTAPSFLTGTHNIQRTSIGNVFFKNLVCRRP